MKVLSLFDGMACGLTALKRAGIQVDEYHAFEIDKYALQVAAKNHPEIIQHGSVVGADFTQFKGFDLVIAGSPCQGFSFSGKQLAFDDPRSALYFEYERALKEINPKHFLLENVVMQKKYSDVISERMEIQPLKINSMLVSAQSRPRLYWFNWDAEAPQDRNIFLMDILEESVDEKYIIKENHLKRLAFSTDLEKRFSAINPDKAICMTARQFANWKGTYVSGRIVGRRINDQGIRDDYNKDIPIRQRLEIRIDGKSNCMTTVSKDSILACINNDGVGIRKLTPVEAERLQTLPDNYTDCVSDSQRYKMLGNGWNIETLAHIFSSMKV